MIVVVIIMIFKEMDLKIREKNHLKWWATLGSKWLLDSLGKMLM